MRKHIITGRPHDNRNTATLKIIDHLNDELDKTKKELAELKLKLKSKQESEAILIGQLKYLSSLNKKNEQL